jgi:hypothetical protein
MVEQQCASLPCGDGESCTPTPTEHLFTGKERDSESGNDYFGMMCYLCLRSVNQHFASMLVNR